MASTEDETRSGSLWGFSEPSAEAARRLDREDEIETLAQRFEQLSGVENVGEGYWSDKTGRVWRHDPGLPAGGRNADEYAFAVADDLSAVWFRVPEDGPRTVEQLQRRRERAVKAREEQEREHQKRLRELRKVAVPITIGHLDGQGQRMTLAEAAERIESHGGVVELANDRLVVKLPPGAIGGLGSDLDAARLLYVAEGEAVRCLKAKRPLPDRQILPTGALAPE